MAHWVMIEMAKLSKEKRDRIARLLGQGLCCKCEKGKEVARWQCASCLSELYGIQKHGDPLKAAEYENKEIRLGRLAPRYDKSFSHLRVKRSKPVRSA